MSRLISRFTMSLTFVTLLSSRCALGQQSPQNVSDVVKATVNSVVLILINDESGKPVSLGSGFIVSSDGKIVTNHHVIAGARSALVKLNNGAFYPVEGIVADDPDRDIAVIKVSGKNLPSLMFADSDALSVGDHVVAIGSPIGLENSVSDGIISGFREDSKSRTWIQTTAPASHGKNGGPLLTMDEKVAGILTRKNTEGENLNFAVPSKMVAALLANSTVRPLGSASNADLTPLNPAEERVWTSTSNATDHRVRIDGNYIYTQWINPSPSDLESRGSFMRAELRKTGDKWVGKETRSLPFLGCCLCFILLGKCLVIYPLSSC